MGENDYEIEKEHKKVPLDYEIEKKHNKLHAATIELTMPLWIISITVLQVL